MNNTYTGLSECKIKHLPTYLYNSLPILPDTTYKKNGLSLDSTGYETSINLPNENIKCALRDIGKLKDDWDSYGALAPSLNTIELVTFVVSCFEASCQPQIIPETNGSIGLYWTSSNLIYLSVNENNINCPDFHEENFLGEILVDYNSSDKLLSGSFDLSSAISLILEKLNKSG